MTLPEVRRFLEEKSFQDSNLPSLELQGKSIKEILSRAALELRVPVGRLNYEVITRGTSGLVRLFWQKDYQLLVYRQVQDRKDGKEDHQTMTDTHQAAEEMVHGAAHVQHRSEGLFLKVNPPLHGGQEASLNDVLHMIEEVSPVKVATHAVKQVVDEMDGQYHFLLEIPHRPENDARAVVQVDDSKMKASVTLLPPGEDGADPTYDWLIDLLKEKGITAGIDHEKVVDFTDAPHYHSPLLLVEGKEPIAGEDTWIETLFETESYHKEDPQKSRVDFRKSFHISTVTAGQVLAHVHPATEGTPGFDIYGRPLPAKPGVELEPPVGKNVKFLDSSRDLVATVSGEVVYNREQGVIEVQEVHVVNGNLTHNIDFPGSVLIKGDVENDFVVRADGNITVNGYVGRSQLTAGENLIVKSGINGGDSRGVKMIRARSIFASYINNIGAEAIENIELTDGVVNSELIAGRNIICEGRYAAIVGSYVSAQREVRAEIMGSSSEVATKVQVGVNLRAFEEKEKLSSLLAKHREQRNVVQRELRSLLKQQDLWGNPQEPELDPNYEKTKQLKQALEMEEEVIRTAAERLRQIEQETNILAQHASISVQKEIHPGVTLSIGNAVMEVAELYDQPATLRAPHAEIELFPFVPQGEERSQDRS